MTDTIPNDNYSPLYASGYFPSRQTGYDTRLARQFVIPERCDWTALKAERRLRMDRQPCCLDLFDCALKALNRTVGSSPYLRNRRR